MNVDINTSNRCFVSKIIYIYQPSQRVSDRAVFRQQFTLQHCSQFSAFSVTLVEITPAAFSLIFRTIIRKKTRIIFGASIQLLCKRSSQFFTFSQSLIIGSFIYDKTFRCKLCSCIFTVFLPYTHPFSVTPSV